VKPIRRLWPDGPAVEIVSPADGGVLVRLVDDAGAPLSGWATCTGITVEGDAQVIAVVEEWGRRRGGITPTERYVADGKILADLPGFDRLNPDESAAVGRIILDAAQDRTGD